MTPKRRQRLILLCMMILGASISVWLILIALNQNINLFFSPTQVVYGKANERSIFRIGGVVVKNSVKRNDVDLTVQFKITDTIETVKVSYQGMLPDLFREGQGIVATGSMKNGVFVAEQVLAKHDEQYMPPEVYEALESAKTGTEIQFDS